MGALGDPQFRKLWLGQATSQVGNRIHQLAVAWWVLKETGSPALMGAMLVASSLPMVIVSPLAGPLADRLDRRRLMLGCDALSACLVGIMAMLALRHLLPIPLLFVLQFGLATLGAIFTPAALAVIPEVVPEGALMEANSLQELSTQGAGILGPALGGVLTAMMGPGGAFLVNAGTFVVSALALSAMQRPRRLNRISGESYWASLRVGLAILRSRPAIASLLGAFAIANLFLAPIPVLLPIVAMNVFDRGAWGLGVLEGSLGAGMILAALLLAKRGEMKRQLFLIAGSLVVQGALMSAMGAWPHFFGFALGLFGLGAALSALNVVVVSAFQRAIPADQLGRFMGVLTAAVLGIMPASFALVGFLATRIAPTTIFTASGILLALVGFLLPLLPGVRGLEADLSIA